MKQFAHLLLTLALFAAFRRAEAQEPFALSSLLTGGSTVRTVTAMDVNNDGKLDLIFARANQSFVYVWTNSGNGLFASNASYTAGSHPNQVIAVDVNNDGWLDLVTANVGANSLSVLTNNGNGGFALASTLQLPTSSQPDSVAAGDLNGDGRPDLVSANSLLASVTVWTNCGGGIFVSNISLSVGSAGNTVPQWVAIADINGDQKPDIICACNNSDTYYLHIWTNNGVGGFAPSPVPFQSSLLGYLCVVPADVNGDGKVDLVLVANKISSSGVLVMTNNGAGGFAVSGFFSAGNSPYAVALADVNGDGQLDAITANHGDNTMTVLTNSGAGIFGSNTTVSVGSGPESLTAADINGDGRMDLIAGNWNDGTLSVMTNAGVFVPSLTVKPAGKNLLVSWPAVWANWRLLQATNLAAGSWTSFSGAIGSDGTTRTATNSAPVGQRFFRLAYP